MKYWAWMLFIAVGMEYFLNSTGLPIKTDALLTGDKSTQRKPQINFIPIFDDIKSSKTHKLDVDMENHLNQHLRIRRTVGKCLIRMSKAIDRKIQILKELQKALHQQRPSEIVNNFKNINLSDVVSANRGQHIKVNINEDKNLVKSDQKQNDDLVEKFTQLADQSRAITNLLRQEFYSNLTSSIFNNSKGATVTKARSDNIDNKDQHQLDLNGKKDQLQIPNTENKDQTQFLNIEENLLNEVSDNIGQSANANFNKVSENREHNSNKEKTKKTKSGRAHNDDLMDNLKRLAHKSRQIMNLVRQEFYKNPTSSIFNQTRGDITTKAHMNVEDNNDQDQFHNVKKKVPLQLDNTENKDQRQVYRTEKNLRDDVNDNKGQLSEVNYNENEKLLDIGQEYNDKINLRQEEISSSRQSPEVNLNENKSLRKSDPEHNVDFIESFKQLADKARTNMNLRRQELYRNLTSTIFNRTSDDIITMPQTKEEVSLTNHNGNNMKNHSAKDQYQIERISEARTGQEVKRKSGTIGDVSSIGSRNEGRKYDKKTEVKERETKVTNKPVKMKCICEAINETSNESSRYKRDLQEFQGKQTVKTSRKRKLSRSKKHLQNKLEFKHHAEDMPRLQCRSKSLINYDQKYPRMKIGSDKLSSSVECKKQVQQEASIKYISQGNKSNGKKIENLLSRFVKVNLEIQRLMRLYALYEENIKENKKLISQPSSSIIPSDIPKSNVKTSEDSYSKYEKFDEKIGDANLNVDYGFSDDTDLNMMNLYNKFTNFFPKVTD